MNADRIVTVVAAVLAAAAAVMWFGFPRVETKRVDVPQVLPEKPTGLMVRRTFERVQPMSVESGTLLDGRTWQCAYWDDTGSRSRSIAHASVVVQWCVPNR